MVLFPRFGSRKLLRLFCEQKLPSSVIAASSLHSKEAASSSLNTICQNIRFTGPLSVAQFMTEALTDARKGYYIHKDMLGAQGDFVTSPELNQMFGEIVALWFISEWKALGSPSQFQFVELGPGRGTLAEDVLKTFNHFRDKILSDTKISFHFVEVGEKLSEIQYKTLRDPQEICELEHIPESYRKCVSKCGHPLYWHRSINSVPRDQFTFFLAHEFFDALPIHKFVKTAKGWRELYVDIRPGTRDQLHFIKMPEITLATKLIKDDEKRDHVEICPEAGRIVNDIAQRIETNGGASLIIDYGHLGDKEDTMRGFKDHKLNNVFENVGEADLTADVDFSFLLDSTKPHDVIRSGPVTQQAFLKNMGIELRLIMLLRACKDREKGEKLVDSFKLIMDEKEMGERFKFIALTSLNRQDDGPVTGFF